jgi:geranylgeranyl diphosphate synthase type II
MMMTSLASLPDAESCDADPPSHIENLEAAPEHAPDVVLPENPSSELESSCSDDSLPEATPADLNPSSDEEEDSSFADEENPSEAGIVYETRFATSLAMINARLAEVLEPSLQANVTGEGHEAAQGLWAAMRYGTLDGGKRIRAILALAACKACGGELDSILPTACAIELVHAQSLMHDDLPCMDDDDMRRGRPSVHKAYSESTAVLAGDALISLAFGLIAKQTPLRGSVTPSRLLDVLSDFADVTSVQGLVNGQFVDIFYEGKEATPEVLEYIHTYKTGALFRFALSSGARLSGAPPSVVERFSKLGETLGLVFQIVDDLLDIGASSETLGKTAGKDQIQCKATYPALFGEEASRQKASTLIQQASDLLTIRDGMPDIYDPGVLQTLVTFIFQRSR